METINLYEPPSEDPITGNAAPRMRAVQIPVCYGFFSSMSIVASLVYLRFPGCVLSFLILPLSLYLYFTLAYGRSNGRVKFFYLVPLGILVFGCCGWLFTVGLLRLKLGEYFPSLASGLFEFSVVASSASIGFELAVAYSIGQRRSLPELGIAGCIGGLITAGTITAASMIEAWHRSTSWSPHFGLSAKHGYVAIFALCWSMFIYSALKADSAFRTADNLAPEKLH
jgi:hypothetical protein